jgi:hypothetical protein
MEFPSQPPAWLMAAAKRGASVDMPPPEIDTVLTMQMGPQDVLFAARVDLADGLDSDTVEAVR